MDDLFQLVAAGARLAGRPPPDAAPHGDRPGFLTAFEAAGTGASTAARAAPDPTPDPARDKDGAAPAARFVQVPESPPVAVDGAFPGGAAVPTRIGAARSEGTVGDKAAAMGSALVPPVGPPDALSPDGRPGVVATEEPAAAAADLPEEAPDTEVEQVVHVAVPATQTPGPAEAGAAPLPVPLVGTGGAIRAGAEATQGARPHGVGAVGPTVAAGDGLASPPGRGLPDVDADAATVAAASASPKAARGSEGVAQAPLAPPHGPVADHAAIAPGGAGPAAAATSVSGAGGVAAAAVPLPSVDAVRVAWPAVIRAAPQGDMDTRQPLPAALLGSALSGADIPARTALPEALVGPGSAMDKPTSPPAESPSPAQGAALEVTSPGQPDRAAHRDIGSGPAPGPTPVLPHLLGVSSKPAAQPDIRPEADPGTPVTVAAPVARGHDGSPQASGAPHGLAPSSASRLFAPAGVTGSTLSEADAPWRIGPVEGARAPHPALAPVADAQAGAAPVVAVGPASVPLPGDAPPLRPPPGAEGAPFPVAAGVTAPVGRKSLALFPAPPHASLPAKGAALALQPETVAPLVVDEGGSPLALSPSAEQRAPVGVMPPPAPAHAMPGTVLAQGMARQLSQALAERQGAEGVLEIALDPPELGRVRLSFAEAGGAVTLAITADRPETAELMRRHLHLLTQEFQRAGLDAPSVDISDRHGGTRQEGRADTPGAPPRAATGPAIADPGPAPTRPQPRDGRGLDLRL